ncbi:MAG: hypothetical protein NVS4B7_01000 [Ktedonobacteraceae bacterium]
MKLDFKRDYWADKLQYADWYVRLADELREFFFPLVHDDPQLKAFRHEVYELIEEMLASQRIPLAERGPDLDAERKPIDTVVIHHTEEEPEMRLSKLSAIGLVRQYAFEYLENEVPGRRVRGEPIWSGHFRNGRMVFFAYHWLVRTDGTALRLLEDEYIGWHAGHWETNTRCIGIALAGNYEYGVPPLPQIEGVVKVMRNNYSSIDSSRIVGHREVRVGVSCPGAYFLHGWKERLLDEGK